MSEEKTVFISYRRRNSAYIARAIFEHLRLHAYDVFMDVESIGPGEFERIIRNQIRARAHFVVVLAPGSLERFKEPGDWMRREIEWAIEMQRNVVPVMANGFQFHDYAEYLMGPVSALQGFNALSLFHEYFDAGMERLRDVMLKQPVYGDVEPAPAGDVEEVKAALAVAVSEPPPSDKELSAENHYMNGIIRSHARAYEAAIANFTEAIQLKSDYAEAYNERGTVHHNLEDYQEAIDDYTEAIHLKRDYPKFYINRGDAYFAVSNYSDALSDFDSALELGLNSEIVLIGRAVSLHALGRVDEALDQWRELVAKDARYRDADWVGEELDWRPELVEEARKLIAKL